MTTVLRGMTWEHARGYGSVANTIAAYRQVRPDVEVQWEYRSLQAFADQPLEEMVHEYDLMVIDHPHIPHAAENGLLARLDGQGFDDELEVLSVQTVGSSHVSYAHSGGQWGLATDAAAHVACYRPDLMGDPPTTWQDVLELAEEGRVLWPYKPIDAFSSLVSVAASNGEEAMRQSGVFLSPEGLEEAMATLRRLAELVPEENSTWNPIQAADALAASSHHTYVPLLFGYTNYSRAGFRNNRLKYIDAPVSVSGGRGSLLAGAGIVVSAFSQHLPEAIEYAFWLDSADVQEGIYYDGGGQPGNRVAWESDRTNADSLDFFRGTRATMEAAYLRPRFAGFIDVQNHTSELIHRALIGQLTDQRLADELNRVVATYMEEL